MRRIIPTDVLQTSAPGNARICTDRRSGFTSAALMGEIFQRELGMSPSAYQQILAEREKR